MRLGLMMCLLGSGVAWCGNAPADDPLNPELAGRMVQLALDCAHKEYPNKIAHVMSSDQDALPPRSLTPAFFGCFDWHSCVHGHWLMARLARRYPHEPWATTCFQTLEKSLTRENIQAELQYLRAEGRDSFERPYGMAWLLCLAAELRQWPEAMAISEHLKPLEDHAATVFKTWLPKLTYPIRTGEHSQTAFAFGLVWDWAKVSEDREMRDLMEKTILRLYGNDVGCPLAYEPSGQDFLSPCLAEADLMRRVMNPLAYASWLARFLPQIPHELSDQWIEVAVVSDPQDGKLVHLDGLNISRAWMLEGMASGLPADDPRKPALQGAAVKLGTSGIQAISSENYEGSHWLGSFAVYWLTRAGL